MHLLKFNRKAKTLTEVPPGELGADSDCRYFYVQGKHVAVPISTPDGIGEIVWQHPDYHHVRPMTLRDRVTLAQVEIVYGTEQPPVINVEDYAFFDPSLGEPWEDNSDA